MKAAAHVLTTASSVHIGDAGFQQEGVLAVAAQRADRPVLVSNGMSDFSPSADDQGAHALSTFWAAGVVMLLVMIVGLLWAQLRRTSRAEAIAEKTRGRDEISDTASLLREPGELDSLDFAYAVNQRVNADYYMRLLATMKASLRENGFELSRKATYGLTLSYEAHKQVARDVAFEEILTKYPAASEESRVHTLETWIEDGYAAYQLDGLLDAVGACGYRVSPFTKTLGIPWR